MVTVVTSLGWGRISAAVMASSAVDPQVFEVLLVGVIEPRRVDLVVAGPALDFHVVEVHPVRELHPTDSGRE
jgi:hypothetical protein